MERKILICALLFTLCVGSAVAASSSSFSTQQRTRAYLRNAPRHHAASRFFRSLVTDEKPPRSRVPPPPAEGDERCETMCNMERAQEFRDKHGLSDTTVQKTKKVSTEALLESLKAVGRAMERAGVKWYIAGGTLLGWYRECETIAWDHDGDAGVLAKDWSPRILEELQREGFRLRFSFGQVHKGLEYALELHTAYGVIHQDIFFVYDDDNSCNCYWQPLWNGKTLRRLKFPRFNIIDADYLGVKVGVPDRCLEYMKSSYGEAWNTPQKSWDWWSSNRNIYKQEVVPDGGIHYPGR
eukprot:GILI01009025.1.p1 GENE.GILI01009025.1~~GILI01009025.1.p1  ORF type:complete len:296 (+),score=71.07 GILI01009025.1:138-1025(+)